MHDHQVSSLWQGKKMIRLEIQVKTATYTLLFRYIYENYLYLSIYQAICCISIHLCVSVILWLRLTQRVKLGEQIKFRLRGREKCREMYMWTFIKCLYSRYQGRRSQKSFGWYVPQSRILPHWHLWYNYHFCKGDVSPDIEK